MGTTAILDAATGTLTVLFDGDSVSEAKRALSPRVIPVGAISGVEYEPKSADSAGWIRVVLVGRYGYDADPERDLNTWFLGWRGAETFVAELREAMAESPKLGDAPAHLRQSSLTASGRRHNAGRLVIETDGVHFERSIFGLEGSMAVLEDAAGAESKLATLRATQGVTVLGDLEPYLGGLPLPEDQKYLFIYLQGRTVLTAAEAASETERLDEVCFLINQAARL